MARINDDYRKLQAGYLFPEIGRRVKAFQAAHPDAAVIRLGIGDVTLPLAPAVVQALRDAADEMGTPDGFRGYGPERGAEDFLVDGKCSLVVALSHIDARDVASQRQVHWMVRREVATEHLFNMSVDVSEVFLLLREVLL